MIFQETKLKGSFIIEPDRLEDKRGFFARTWCKREFEAHGLNPKLVQCNISFNKIKGTLRGMHYQEAPREEARLVRCTEGAIYDVIIDLRPDSPTYCQWISVVLSAPGSQPTSQSSQPTANSSQPIAHYKMLYVPEGFAHGFLTLEDNTEVFYQMSEFYAPECARGVRWNDPAFNILWPEDVVEISDRDKQYPDFVS
jgi:dTDP-4-dehydrorhamnose 3,5-epimerase